MLDPYFRTIKGFQVLVEKDWLSFGHQFHRRFGHFNSNHKDNQRCPVFVQWLDAVHQIICQYPTHFEFNKAMLLLIAEEVVNCKYGTFLFNNTKERMQFDLKSKAVSLWSVINMNRQKYLNPFFDEVTQFSQLLSIPSTNYFELKVWREYYFKFSQWNYFSVNPHFSCPEDLIDSMMWKEKEKNKELTLLLNQTKDLILRIEQSSDQEDHES